MNIARLGRASWETSTEKSTEGSLIELTAADQFGHDVLGPVVGEFCLRLWWISRLIDEPDETALLFCARGGLRMQLAYEHFLDATARPSPMRTGSLMVSRLVAMRGSVLRAVHESRAELFPTAAAALNYEFVDSSVRTVVAALSGIEVSSPDPRWDEPQTSAAVIDLLRGQDGEAAAAELQRQEALFTEHLDKALGGCRRGVLVDTGFYGTTRELLAEGHADVDWGSLLLARSFRPGYPAHGSRTVGVLVEAAAYVPFQRRTSLLRHWHYVEWLFEPELDSVSGFRHTDDGVRSNLEARDWAGRLPPEPGSAFAGVVRYIDGLTSAPAMQIARDVDRAWTRLHRAIVWPDQADGAVLAVGRRTHDFGRDEAWTTPPWSGPMSSLRGSTTWREGMIARAGTPWRWLLLLTIELGYSGRFAIRTARAKFGRRR